MRISDVCKEYKKNTKLSNNDIATQANIPLTTVANFMSVGSKAPSVYTVGPICRVLGVSLDEYFGIKSKGMNEEEIRRIEEGYEKKYKDDILLYQEESQRTLDSYRISQEHKAELLEIANHRIKFLHRAVAALCAICIIMLLYIIGMDIFSATRGFLRY